MDTPLNDVVENSDVFSDLRQFATRLAMPLPRSRGDVDNLEVVDKRREVIGGQFSQLC